MARDSLYAFFDRSTLPSPRPAPSALGLLVVLALAITALLALASTPALAAPPAEFGSEGDGAGQFIEPAGVAVQQEDGEIYIVDRNNARVDKFGPNGEFLLAFGWGVADGGPELQTCTTVCRAGLEGAGAGELEFPLGVAVDNDLASPSHGDVYVGDPRNHRVQKFGPAGEFLLMLGGEVNAVTHADVCLAGEQCQAGVEGSGAGFFEGQGQHALAVGPDGSLYVGDANRVQKFSPGGSLLAQIALPGAGSVEQLAVDSASALYVAAAGFSGVHKYDSSGTELGQPRNPSAPGSLSAIAIGSGDGLFLNEGEDTPASHHLLAFDSSGKELSRFDAGLEGGTRGIAYGEGLGALYVLNATKVRVLSPPPPGPLVLLGSESAAEVATTTATLRATLNPEGGEETEYHFEYGTQAGLYPEATPSATLEPVDEAQALTLKATSGSYLLRFKAEPSVEIPFDDAAAELQAALEGIATIGAGNVSVAGAEGGPYEIEFTAALGGSDQPQLEAESVSLKETIVEGEEERTKPGTASVSTIRPGIDSFEDRPISAPISGLDTRTTYHFRVVATNKAGESTAGPDQRFTTLPPVSIDSTSASQVAATSARLEAELNPHGLPTTYHFEYDTLPYVEGEAPHGTSTPIGETGPAGAELTVTALIQGLTLATTYHYRLSAENSLGAVQGPDRTLTTQGAASSLLPDGRAWELVSPPDKNGIPLEAITESGADIQASAGCSASSCGFAYVALGSIGSEPGGNRSFASSQLLARRGAAGWSTTDLTTPNEAVQGIVVGRTSEYKLFSSDLARAAVEPYGATPLSSQTSERTPYLRQPGGDYTPLVTGCPASGECPAAVAAAANVPPGTRFGGEESKPGIFEHGVEFVSATPDAAHLILSSPTPLSAGFTATGQASLYEWSAGALTLLSQVPAAPAGLCGGAAPACLPAAEAGLDSQLGNAGQQVRHAVSADGNRVFFRSAGFGSAHLYARDLARGETLQLDALAPGARGGNDDPIFQTASSDGSRVFFTDTARLTADSTATAGQPDLYLCQLELSAGDLSCALSDLSVDPTPGRHADVQGDVIGASEDGSSLYFVANGALAPGAVPGDCESEGNPAEKPASESCNLYRYDTVAESTTLVAVLSARDGNDWKAEDGRDLGKLTARVSPDGRWLAFMSQRSLTGYDNRDAVSGQPDEEVFLYDGAADGGQGKLICPSCNPTGIRPHGFLESPHPAFPLVDRPHLWTDQWLVASVPGWTRIDAVHALTQSRYLSDSGRLFFNSADPLVPQDSNGTEDVYQYEPAGVGGCAQASPSFGSASGGCVELISSGSSGGESAFLDASENGDDVFFLTASKLAPTDVDNALDVYDAHVCSAEVPCPPPPPPAPPACAGDACQQPATPPGHPTPGTALYNGPGNVLQCPKGKVKQKGKCVKRKAKHTKKHKGEKHHKKHRKSKRTAGHKGGGGK